MRFLVVGALLFTACFSTPGFKGDGDAGSGSDGGNACMSAATGLDLSLVTSGATEHWTATIPGGTVIQFDDGRVNYPFPSSIRVNNVELLAPPAGCSQEDRVGLAAYPRYSISNVTIQDTEEHGFTRFANGDALAHGQINWSYINAPGNGCSMPMRGAGTTDFAMYPDGRVTRYDVFYPSTDQATMLTSACSCAGSTHFTVTSYWTMASSQMLALTRDAAITEGATGVPDHAFAPDVFDADRVCAQTTGSGRIGFQWRQLHGNSVEPTRTNPPTRVRGAGDGLAFVFDFLVGDEDEIDTIPRVSGADAFWALRTTMLFDGGTSARSCVDINTTLQLLDHSPSLFIGGAEVPYGNLGWYDDGIDATSPGHTTGVSLSAPDNAIPPGFAVRLKFPGSTAVTIADRDDVVWQRDEGDIFTLFFRNGLARGSTITVTPGCS